jgi:hypothetical protein
MTTLEATVEIVKAVIANAKASVVITNDPARKKFLRGVEELYKTLSSIQEEFRVDLKPVEPEPVKATVKEAEVSKPEPPGSGPEERPA